MAEFGVGNEMWQVAKPDKVVEVVSSLPEALKNKNLDQIQAALKDPKILHGAIMNRGEENKNLILLRDSFDLMFAEEFGVSYDLYSVDSRKILDWIHKIGWPENVLNEMVGSAYNLGDNLRFFKLTNIILSNEGQFNDPTVFARALHDLASWQSTVEENSEKSLMTNKEALGSAMATGDSILQTKIKFGITIDKALKPRDKAESFEKYREKFAESGDEIEATRAMIEAADAYANLAKGQWGDSASLKIKNLDKAEYLAAEALQKAESLGGYVNAIVRAHKVLQKIYLEQGNPQKAEKHRNEAEIMQKIAGIKQK